MDTNKNTFIQPAPATNLRHNPACNPLYRDTNPCQYPDCACYYGPGATSVLSREAAGNSASVRESGYTKPGAGVVVFRRDIGGGGATVSWYVPPESDTLTRVIPAEKKWSQTPLPPDQRGKMPDEYEDPAEYIQRFLARPHKELGRSVIDGVEVEGIEVTDPPTKDGELANGIGRMWVDVRTELPVRIELEGPANGKTARWLMEFKWSEAVDPALFKPNIPSDYTPMAQ